MHYTALKILQQSMHESTAIFTLTRPIFTTEKVTRYQYGAELLSTK